MNISSQIRRVNIVAATSNSDALNLGVTSTAVSTFNFSTRILKHYCEIDLVFIDFMLLA